jgi:hypothetical protein
MAAARNLHFALHFMAQSNEALQPWMQETCMETDGDKRAQKFCMTYFVLKITNIAMEWM